MCVPICTAPVVFRFALAVWPDGDVVKISKPRTNIRQPVGRGGSVVGLGAFRPEGCMFESRSGRHVGSSSRTMFCIAIASAPPRS